MGSAVLRDVLSFVAWLDEERTAHDTRTYHAFDLLLDEANRKLSSDVARSLEITAFVVRNVDGLTVPPCARAARTVLCARARRERGNALRVRGDLRGALAAFREAAAMLADDPTAILELLAARRGEAFLLHLLGDTDRALQILHDDAPVFDAHGDARGQVISAIYEGSILFEANRPDEAAAVFHEALRTALLLGDTDSVSRLYNNLGHCAQVLGDRGQAVQYLAGALVLFDEHGMTTERERALVGLAQLLVDDGLVDRAIAELQRVQQAFLDRGLPLDAASTALDILEVLCLADRPGRQAAFAANLVNTFSEAGLAREAMRALAFVGKAAAEGTLNAAAIAETRRFVRGLGEGRGMVFVEPE